MDSKTFGKLSSFNTVKQCDPRFIRVPLTFSISSAASGALVYSDVIDLTPFLNGNPSPFVEGLQTLVVYQRGGNSAAITNDGFLSEFIFENGFKCFSPGRSWSAISILCSSAPIIQLRVYAEQPISAATTVTIDYYFANFAIDEMTSIMKTV